MNVFMDDDCARRIREIEDRLLWALSIAKNSEFIYAVLPNLITFLALSCRFAAKDMDPQCRNVMSGYEDDILKLNFRTDAEKIAGLQSVLENVKSYLADR